MEIFWTDVRPLANILTLRLQQIRSIARFSVFDTYNEEGRSNERHRRIFMMAVASAFSKVVIVGTSLISVYMAQ